MNRIFDYEHLSTKIVEWIKNYAETNNIKTLVVGVSGGIDSSVVSTLCAKTEISTIAVNLPLNTFYKNNNMAEKQISFLLNLYSNVKSTNIDLSNIFKEFKFLPQISNEYNSELGFANSKSRLRMLTLYQIASSTEGVVVGTGNKVEDFGIGFFTKYGDGGVDLSPIADLYKTEVRELGKYLGVPNDIINSDPTDGLWDDNRNDEEQIGYKYEDLEWVMEVGLKKMKFSDVTEKENKLITHYLNLNTKNKHKMNQIPIFNLKENNII